MIRIAIVEDEEKYKKQLYIYFFTMFGNNHCKNSWIQNNILYTESVRRIMGYDNAYRK